MSRNLLTSLALVVGFSLAPGRSAAQSVVPNAMAPKTAVAIRNATIYPVTSAAVSNGTIVISKGKIAAIGRDVPIPEGATVIDGTGLSVYPGFIDAGTNIGLTEISSVSGTNDISEIGELNPNARVEFAINPHSEVIPVTRVNGVTTVVSRPEGGLISGQDALIQLSGWTSAEMVLKAPVGMHINFPRAVNSASREEPQEEEAEKEARKSYSKQLDKLRDIFRDTRAYVQATEAKTAKERRPVKRDLVLESFIPVVKGTLPIVMHADRTADLKEAIKFADEMKVKMILSGAEDVQRVIPELKSRNIPVILGPIWSLPSREDDPYDVLFTNAAALHAAGIRFAVSTGDSHNARNLPYQAAACAAFGLPKDVALKAITTYPAEILGVADRIGSLEKGKIANLFIADGDPLEIRTNILKVFIGGEEMPMDSRHTQLYDKFRKRPKQQD